MIVMTMIVVRMVAMVCMPKTLFAMEDIEIQAEGIQGRDKDARHHRKQSKTRARDGAGCYSFNNRIFGIKAREERRTNQGQATQEHHQAGDGHVLP